MLATSHGAEQSCYISVGCKLKNTNIQNKTKIEKEVCKHQKYGFCKYKESCSKIHLTEECTDLNNCKSKGSCDKRHPKLCRRYILENSCSFGENCDYLHREKEKSPEENNLKERLEQLEKVVKAKETAEIKMERAVREMEKVVKAMSRKVIHLEEEIVNIKDNNKINATKEPFKDKSDYKSSTPVGEKTRPTIVENKIKDSEKVPDVPEIMEKKDVEELKEKYEDKLLKYDSSSENKAKDTKSEMKQIVFSCSECDYVAKKEKFLKKHILTKHQDHICKECKEKFQTFMELFKHLAEHHSSEHAEGEEVTGEVDPNDQ